MYLCACVRVYKAVGFEASGTWVFLAKLLGFEGAGDCFGEGRSLLRSGFAVPRLSEGDAEKPRNERGIDSVNVLSPGSDKHLINNSGSRLKRTPSVEFN